MLGTESQYGAFSEVSDSREVVMKIAAKHPEMIGIGIMLKEAVGLGLATPPGLSGFAGSRPSPSPVVRLFSFLVPKTQVQVCILIGDESIDCDEMHERGAAEDAVPPLRPLPPVAEGLAAMTSVPLIALAWGRSGDKGNKANVGIIARKKEYLPYICAALTTEAVRERFAHFLADDSPDNVERFLLPGTNALNFLLHDVLGGGGIASLRNDPQGKGYAQLLLSCPIPIPATLAETL